MSFTAVGITTPGSSFNEGNAFILVILITDTNQCCIFPARTGSTVPLWPHLSNETRKEIFKWLRHSHLIRLYCQLKVCLVAIMHCVPYLLTAEVSDYIQIGFIL
jgi:hypothetical protein